MGSNLLPAMNVLSLFAETVMNMREERALSHALNVEPDTSALKVIQAAQMLLFPYCLLVNMNIKFNQIPGSARVDGDEEEDEFDDLDNEFDYESNDHRYHQHGGDANAPSGRHNIGRVPSNASGLTAPLEMDSSTLNPEIPLLTYGQEVKLM